MLFGQDSYLDAYRAGRVEAEHAAAALRDLTRDHPEQQGRLVALAGLSCPRTGSARTAIGVRRAQGREPAMEAVRAGRGQQITDDFRKIAREVQRRRCSSSCLRTTDAKRHVVVCENGREVAAVEANRPDLVLMDIQMPEMDGFAMNGDDRGRCLAVGMDDYLAKSIRRDQLAAVLARFTGDAPRWPEPAKLKPALDEAAALAYAGDDRALLTELLGIFLEDFPAHLQAIRDAVVGADPATLLSAAHTMSGSLRVLAAAEATALLGRLETLGREGRVEGAVALLALLEPEMERVRATAGEMIGSVTPA